jgi:hypothetical protein
MSVASVLIIAMVTAFKSHAKQALSGKKDTQNAGKPSMKKTIMISKWKEKRNGIRTTYKKKVTAN